MVPASLVAVAGVAPTSSICEPCGDGARRRRRRVGDRIQGVEEIRRVEGVLWTGGDSVGCRGDGDRACGGGRAELRRNRSPPAIRASTAIARDVIAITVR